MKKGKLTKKELLFCHYFAMCANAREAASKSGYASPERAGMKLMARKEIREEISSLSTQNAEKKEIISGLKRLAFGSVADCLRLILADREENFEIENMDFFNISEIKKPKGGGLEIKFFDRLKALEKLSVICESGDESSSMPFYEAIRKSAKALDGKNNE
ncbi:MAG: terminase small subunit [Clostridia bacterium]|nr:terminase small subunit [Clostridia bacterium]